MLIDTIRTIILGLTANCQMFTAYDITLLVRAQGETVRHGEVKAIVHDLMRNEFNANYVGQLRTFSLNAWPAIVYFPDGDDVADYDPNAVKASLATVTTVPVATVPVATVTVPVVTSFQSAPLAFDGKEIVVGSGNRVRVPADSIRNLGLKAGDKAFVAVETDGKIIISASQPVGKDAKPYTVDEYENLGLRVTIPGVEKLKVGTDGARLVLTIA